MNCDNSVYDFSSQITIASNTVNLIENGSVVTRTAGSGVGIRFDTRQNVVFTMTDAKYRYNAGTDDAINANDTRGTRFSMIRSELDVNVVRNGLELNNSNDAQIALENAIVNVIAGAGGGDALAFWAPLGSRGFQNFMTIDNGSDVVGNRFGALISIREGDVLVDGQSSVLGRSGGIVLNVAGVDKIDVLGKSTVSGVDTVGIGAVGVNQSARPLIINVNDSTIIGGNTSVFGIAGGSISLDGSISQNAQIAVSNGSLLDGRVTLTRNADSMSVENASVRGDINLGAGDDELTISVSEIVGDVFAGAGSDEVNVLAGADLTSVALLDGGDDVSSADGMIDTLNFDGLRITAPEMVNWELTNVINGANVTFAMDLTTETLTTDSTSTAVLADALTITGDVVNDGTINMQSGTATGTATIDGSLTGSGTLAISIDVGTDIADVLTVTGGSTGASIAIRPNPISAVPATGNDVLVATVNGTTAAGDFTLPNGTTMQTINGVTYELVLVGNNWFLRANGTPMIAKIPSTSVWGLLAVMLVMMFAAMATMVMATTTAAARRQARQCTRV
ncbi:autotransporter outer membrane beta-barrel domain-containing protein [Ostreibacterium oceani]|uniref:Uncharacterized protein n=1 Tax=Ostreibacterium oceani TaxID=2654998 RepID=A0A6N7EUV7_9GAMM|nr:hypothetical protein [Ostreibacterium oceani]MPV85395.1 hypothetical protein [Ostreibacterium oceani]